MQKGGEKTGAGGGGQPQRKPVTRRLSDGDRA
jgi:hypothetical protein